MPSRTLLIEYLRASFGRAVLLLAGALGVVLTVISIAAPLVTRIAGIALIASSLLIGQFQAWRDMRNERDSVLAGLTGLKRAVRARSIRFDGLEVHYLIRDPSAGSEVQLVIQLYNFGSELVRYDVESFSMLVADITVVVEEPTRGHDIAPERTDKYYFPALFGVDPTSWGDGAVSFKLRYGHPDVGPSRLMTREVSFTLMRPHGGELADQVWWTTVSESDEPIEATSESDINRWVS